MEPFRSLTRKSLDSLHLRMKRINKNCETNWKFRHARLKAMIVSFVAALFKKKKKTRGKTIGTNL